MSDPVQPTPGRFVVPANRALVVVCVMLATLMQALDNTIANVALPYMQGSLSATPDQITWVLTSYVVAAAIFTAPVGWLAARFGRRNFFIVCLVGFTAASMLCGIATNLSQIVAFRLLQGMFGAALVPLSQATMLDLYPIEQRGSAMAMWGMGVMVGPILGPTLGGYLTDIYDWRWVFFINVPFGILAVAGLWYFMTDTKRDAGLKFDWIGFGALGLALAAFQLMLDRGEQKDWFHSTEIVAELVLAGLGFWLFILQSVISEKPFIPMRIFRDTNFLMSFVIMFAIGMILLSSSALLPPYLQTLGHYSVRTTGLLMAPRGLGTMAAMVLAGRLTAKTDPRLLMAMGIAALCWSMWLMIDWTPEINVWALCSTTFLQGLGLGFVFIPLQVVSFATLDSRLRGDGAALLSLIRNVGSAVGISISSFLLVQSTQTMHARIAEGLTPYNRMLQSHGAALFWNDLNPAGLAGLNAEVTRQASIIAYANDFKFLLWVSVPSVALLFLLRRPVAKPAVLAPTTATAPQHAAVLDRGLPS